MSSQPPEHNSSLNRGRVRQARSYIDQNRDRYDEGALRSRLAEHGYSEAEIQAAFSGYGDLTDAPTTDNRWSWSSCLIIFLIVILAIGLLILGNCAANCWNFEWGCHQP
jgi:hypothetical protein